MLASIEKIVDTVKNLALEKVTKGDCFGNAMRLAKNLERGDVNDVRLVHGSVKPDEKRFQHAWVEVGSFVHDPTIDLHCDKSEYYKSTNAKPEKYYGDAEAVINSIKSGHMGPWH